MSRGKYTSYELNVIKFLLHFLKLEGVIIFEVIAFNLGGKI